MNKNTDTNNKTYIKGYRVYKTEHKVKDINYDDETLKTKWDNEEIST